LVSVPSVRSVSTVDDTHRVNGLFISSTMPNCSTSPETLGNWPTITPSFSSPAMENAVGRSATNASISPVFSAILASPLVL
jgi:hypothetical protein